MPLASADSVLRASPQSAEVNSPDAENATAGPVVLPPESPNTFIRIAIFTRINISGNTILGESGPNLASRLSFCLPLGGQNVAPGLRFPMRYIDIAIIGGGLA